MKERTIWNNRCAIQARGSPVVWQTELWQTYTLQKDECSVSHVTTFISHRPTRRGSYRSSGVRDTPPPSWGTSRATNLEKYTGGVGGRGGLFSIHYFRLIIAVVTQGLLQRFRLLWSSLYAHDMISVFPLVIRSQQQNGVKARKWILRK